MKNKSKLLFIFLSSIVAGLLIAIAVTAWTNPIGNPTSGGGALYYKDGNVGIGTVSPSTKLHVAGGARITGLVSCNTIDTDASGNLVCGTDETGAGGGTPQGGIIMYSGAWNFDGTGLGTGSLAGWALCNGNNGTPNLSDRFVMGTVSSPTPGATGGSASHTHNVGTYSSINHTHTIPNHTHTIPNHTHTYSGTTNTVWATIIGGYGVGTTQEAVKDHSHSFSGTTGSGGADTTSSSGGGNTGSSGANLITGTSASESNLPPYLKLAFIMKI
jgi:Tfp pilus assembly protein PilV